MPARNADSQPGWDIGWNIGRRSRIAPCRHARRGIARGGGVCRERRSPFCFLGSSPRRRMPEPVPSHAGANARRYRIASAICAALGASSPARSAIVRATFSTR
ncbi:hypothetical protein DO70_4346 [Burkholderia pseudomallei]|nr:hypothetical protein DO70_4346 [Burkholderia pseudomallei]